MQIDKEKLKSMEDVIKSIDTKLGKGTLIRMGGSTTQKVDIISTGSIALDYALGVWGLPRGRIIECYGPESSGKSAFALHAISIAQKSGGVCAFLDLEHSLDMEWCKILGVDTDSLYMSQPDSGEDMFYILETLLNSKAIDIAVIDSVAAILPQSERESDFGEAPMAKTARLMSQAMRKLTGTINKSNACVIFINQIRKNIGGYGKSEVTTGGEALKFYSSIRLELRKGELIKEGEDIIGHTVKAHVVKNKVAAPFKKAEIPFYYDRGYDNFRSMVDIAAVNNIINKSGTWYAYKEERIGQGIKNASKFLADNPKVYKEIEESVYKVLGRDRLEEKPKEVKPASKDSKSEVKDGKSEKSQSS